KTAQPWEESSRTLRLSAFARNQTAWTSFSQRRKVRKGSCGNLRSFTMAETMINAFLSISRERDFPRLDSLRYIKSIHLQKIAKQSFARRGHYRFGVKLHALADELTMPQPHHKPVRRRGGDL